MNDNILRPVSRFPLGLLDLLGVKQMGAYPDSLTRQMQSSVEILPLLLQTNAQLAAGAPQIGLVGAATAPSSYINVVDSSGVPLQSAANEILIITKWSIYGSWSGVGSEMPDAQLCHKPQVAGAEAFFWSDRPRRGNLAGSANLDFWSNGDSNCAIVVPPLHSVALRTLAIAISVAANSLTIQAQCNYHRLRV